MKTTVTKNENIERKEDLKEIAILWEHVSEESKITYLSGNLAEELSYAKIIAFYNTTKKNEKEPDIRIYILNDENKKDHEIMSLWEQTSKQNVKYYSGLTDEKESVVAFINGTDDIKQPKIRIYLKK